MTEEKVLIFGKWVPKESAIWQVAKVTESFDRSERQEVGYIGTKETVGQAIVCEGCAAIMLCRGQPVSAVAGTPVSKKSECEIAVATAIESRGKGCFRRTFEKMVGSCLDNQKCKLEKLMVYTRNGGVARVCLNNGFSGGYELAEGQYVLTRTRKNFPKT